MNCMNDECKALFRVVTSDDLIRQMNEERARVIRLTPDAEYNPIAQRELGYSYQVQERRYNHSGQRGY